MKNWKEFILAIFFMIGFFIIAEKVYNKITNDRAINESYEIINKELRIDGNADIDIYVKDDLKFLEFEMTFYDTNNTITKVVKIKKDNLEKDKTYNYILNPNFSTFDLLKEKSGKM